ncbi:conserved hypothetical protein [Methanococcus vannielii SB]|jgi:hypothetical protein|uniref:Nucleic acid binding OB-fold tRNA/helicase-type n=1 Tax=Methanococcus vannielii (strain ATCC 35089 / DSM 1224 / JCM 13029 / OCM 148 / SB) TaxID=406327 RepID=A6UPU4_METVS|nr:hypothetical protein [Methanococcus vannielii]ABR54516.1 conserved hypothetical protein [Methanococcus vannielii SB]
MYSNVLISELTRHAKTTPSAFISLIICLIFTAWSVYVSKNLWILLMSIPFILGLTLIPIKISNMNKKISDELLPEYVDVSKEYKISEITKESLNNRVKIVGKLDKVIYGISTKPTIRVSDETGKIFSNLISPVPDGIKKGDMIELYGIVAKNYKFFGIIGIPNLWAPKIYGIGVRKSN